MYVLRILHVPAGQRVCPLFPWNCWDVEPWNAGFHLAIAVAYESSNSPDLNPFDYDIGPATGACLPLNSWRQPLDGATDRGVVRLGSQHHLCSSESVAYSSASLRARCMLMEGSLNISCNSNSKSNRYLSFKLIPVVFIVLETYVFSVSSKI